MPLNWIRTRNILDPQTLSHSIKMSIKQQTRSQNGFALSVGKTGQESNNWFDNLHGFLNLDI